MQQSNLAEFILKLRKLQKLSLFLLFINIISIASLYFILVAPAFMADSLSNPAVVKFMGSTEFKQIVEPYFAELNEYDRDPTRQPKPTVDLLVTDPSQFGLVVQVDLYLKPQDESSTDGRTRYRYDNKVRVRPAIELLVIFVGLELVLVSLLVWGLRHKPDPVQAKFESIVLEGYFFPAASDMEDTPAAQNALLHLLDRFYVYARELQATPRAGHAAWKITDEYDVQQALCALLRTHFDSVKPEETTPSIAGSSSRIDFLLVNERTGVEAKMMRNSLTERELGKQLLLDVAHFPAHSKCKSLIFLIYDPTHMICDPASLRKEVIEAAHEFPVEVVYSPPR